MKKKYEDMTRKELVEIAKTQGIRNVGKLKKDAIILAIKSRKKPLKKIREIEEATKKDVPSGYGKTHLEFLPKEPGTVFVGWEVSGSDSKNKEGILKVFEGKKEFISLPVKFPSGKGYLKVDEGEKFVAVVGVNEKGKFKEIISSKPVTVPTSKLAQDGKVEFGRVGAPSKTLKKTPSVSNRIEKEKIKISEEVKRINYIRYPKEGK